MHTSKVVRTTVTALFTLGAAGNVQAEAAEASADSRGTVPQCKTLRCEASVGIGVKFAADVLENSNELDLDMFLKGVEARLAKTNGLMNEHTGLYKFQEYNETKLDDLERHLCFLTEDYPEVSLGQPERYKVNTITQTSDRTCMSDHSLQAILPADARRATGSSGGEYGVYWAAVVDIDYHQCAMTKIRKQDDLEQLVEAAPDSSNGTAGNATEEYQAGTTATEAAEGTPNTQPRIVLSSSDEVSVPIAETNEVLISYRRFNYRAYGSQKKGLLEQTVYDPQYGCDAQNSVENSRHQYQNGAEPLTSFEIMHGWRTRRLPLQGVIPGWREGIKAMKEGQLARLVVDSSKGYGTGGAEGVEPNETLLHEIILHERYR